MGRVMDISLSSRPFTKLLYQIQCGLTILFPLMICTGRSLPDIFVSGGAVLFVLFSILTRDWGWCRTPWFKILLLFWAYSVLRSLFTPDISAALHTSLPWGRYIIFAAMLSHLTLQNPIVRKWLVRCLIAACAFFIFDIFLQSYRGTDLFGRPTHGTRLTGPFRMPRVGITLVWILFPALIYGISLLRPHSKIFLEQYGKTVAKILLLTLVLAAMILPGERTAFLLLGLGLLLFLVLSFSWKNLLVMIISGICIAVVHLLLLGYMKQIQTIQLKPSVVQAAPSVVQVAPSAVQAAPSVVQLPGRLSTALRDNPYLARLFSSTYTAVENFQNNGYGKLFIEAVRLFKQNILFGIGPNQFSSKSEVRRGGGVSRHPHNIILETLVSMGLVGFLLFFAFVFYVFRQACLQWSVLRASPLALGLFITFCLRLFPIAGTTSIYVSWSGTIFWFMTGWFLYVLQNPDQPAAVANKSLPAK